MEVNGGREKREKGAVMNAVPIKQINSTARWSIVAGVAMILVGLVAIITPAVSGVFFSVLIACVLIFSGFKHLIFAVDTQSAEISPSGIKTHRARMWWEIVVGFLYLAFGIYILVHPVAALITLTLALGFYLLLEAVLEFVLSYTFQGMKGAGWLLFHGIITIILSAIVFRTFPRSAVWVIGTVVGISIFFGGVARVALAMGTMHHTPKVIPG